MKKLFIRRKIYAGEDRRSGVPLCCEFGKAVFTHASERVKSPFFMVSRAADGADEMLQIAVGDSICAQGGEVLLIDCVSPPAAALLTRRYRADFTVAVAGGYLEILDKNGCNISREDEREIEVYMREGAPAPSQREGEIYCRRDAWLDYVNALSDAAGNRKVSSKILISCPAGNVKKAAQLLFSRLTKKLVLSAGESFAEEIKKCGADIGFRFDTSGRCLTVFDEEGGIVSAEDIYCLAAAKLAERDALGNTIKENTGKGIRLNLLENGAVHFADMLPAEDALFTALMLAVYVSDKDEALGELVKRLGSPSSQ